MTPRVGPQAARRPSFCRGRRSGPLCLPAVTRGGLKGGLVLGVSKRVFTSQLEWVNGSGRLSARAASSSLTRVGRSVSIPTSATEDVVELLSSSPFTHSLSSALLYSVLLSYPLLPYSPLPLFSNPLSSLLISASLFSLFSLGAVY